MPDEQLDSTGDDRESREESWLRELALYRPANLALYLFILALIISLVVRQELPESFWLAFTGIVGAVATAEREWSTRKRKDE